MTFGYSLIVGIVGMIFILVAFVLDEFYRKFNQSTVKYNILNIIGSAGLVYYAVALSAWPFFVLNIIWFIVAVLKLMGILKKRELVDFSDLSFKGKKHRR